MIYIYISMNATSKNTVWSLSTSLPLHFTTFQQAASAASFFYFRFTGVGPQKQVRNWLVVTGTCFIFPYIDNNHPS